ncbi:MAG: copper chaperone PCu(A)C [Anaerolineae bacterium]|nr:copper chaperone PCu(A)C [Anaerolineae bacterium]
MKSFFPKILLFAILAITALSGCSDQKEIEIQNAWARPALKGGNSAVYFQIKNTTKADDLLKNAACSTAGNTEIHKSIMDENGVMMMKPQESVEIPANATIAFEPGGLHIMLINLNQDLQVGDNLEVSLTFDKAGVITIIAPVKQP